jgi:hypothetical protein
MQITYIGDGSRHGPTVVDVGGIEFPLNRAVDIPAGMEPRFAKLRNNDRFFVDDDADGAPAKTEPDPNAGKEQTKIPSPANFKTVPPGAGAPSRQGGANMGPLPGLPRPPSQQGNK